MPGRLTARWCLHFLLRKKINKTFLKQTFLSLEQQTTWNGSLIYPPSWEMSDSAFYCCDKHMTQSHLGRKGLFQLTAFRLHSRTEDVRTGTQSRNLGVWTGGALLTDLLLFAYSDSFCKHPGPRTLEMVLLTVEVGPPFTIMATNHIDTPTSQSHLDNSSLWEFLSGVSRLCPLDIESWLR